VLAEPVLIGAILVTGWRPVVRKGVAVVVACGEKRGIVGMDAAMDHVPEPGTGECTVWCHRQVWNSVLRATSVRGKST
jgi:hypothetical protein